MIKPDIVILRSRKVYPCTLTPYVRCGVSDDSTSHAVKLRKEDVERNSKIDNGYYDDLCGNCFESLRFTCTVVNILDLRGGKMSSLASVISQEIEQSRIWQSKPQIMNGTLLRI